jgi:photosystem II stability/assembly factor-like uncharacterized protein
MRLLLLLLLFSCFFQLNGQVDFGAPELDANILQSKQYKRLQDFAAARQNNGVNGEFKKWQTWQELTTSNQRGGNMTPWQNFGPDTVSGRIISIAFHPTDSNTFLVGAASGGLWRTSDYGLTWTPLTDAYFTMGIGAITYNPQNPNSILIATGEGYGFGGEFTAGYGVMISYDAGATWNNTALAATLDQSFAGMDIYWNRLDTTKVSVASSFGMYYSSDGGLNYAYTLDRLGGRMTADPMNPDRVYFTARYYTATYPGGLYISTNSGASWTLSGAGLPAPNDFGFASIAVHPFYNHIVYVSVSRSSAVGSGPLEGLYKSMDYGQNFTQVSSNTDYYCYPPPYETICLGWYANTIAISPADTNLLFAGGPRLWTSTDGGVNWAATDIDIATNGYALHPDHHQTVFHPITGDLMDCNDGGVNYSSDMGSTWTSISEGLITHQFYSIAFAETDPEVVIGGTQDVGTFSTKTASTGGWNNDFSGDAFGHVIDHSDEDIWYGSNYINFQRIKTTDAGSNWYLANNGTSGDDQWRMPMAMHPTNSSTLLSSNDNFMYKTTNGGGSWSVVANAGYIGTFEYDKVNPNLVYANELLGSIVYRSTDGGNTWFMLGNSPGNPITDLAADPSNTGVVYATVGSFGANNQLYVSYNSGLNWTNISSGLPSVPAHTVAVCPYNDQEIYVGNEIGVWVSQDGGTTWSGYNDGLPAAIVVEDLHYYAPDLSIRIGTYGRGYWKTNALDLPLDVNDNGQILRKVQAYPNPSNGVFTLSESIGSYTIYTVTGQEILSSDQLEIDLSNMPEGVYILKGKEASLKLIKM